MSQDTESIIRKHVHDMRNHLNGMEMDAIFLADLFPDTDSEAFQISQRFNQELNRIESGLRFLTSCFTDPDVAPMSVTDLFYLWKSRSSKFVTDGSVEWECKAESEFIDVDGRMVADLLGNLLVTASAKSNQPVHASVIPIDQTVKFEIKTIDGATFEGLSAVSDVIGKFDGRLESETLDGEFVIRCVFDVSD